MVLQTRWVALAVLAVFFVDNVAQPDGNSTDAPTSAPAGGDDSSESEAPVGAIVGGVFGGVVFLAAAIAIVVYLRKKGRGHPSNQSTPAAINQYPQLPAHPTATTHVQQYPQLVAPTTAAADVKQYPQLATRPTATPKVGGDAPHYPPPPA